ncbi:MAG: hypothetical protein ACR2G3_00180 [Solirubrobacterales bacterium]
MKRAITTASVCIGLAALAGPAMAAEGNGGRSATAKECTALKKADKAAFAAVYGDHAMRACMKGVTPVAGETPPAEFKNAAKACRAERDADADAFRETYGTNANKRNAFGKCVSGAVRDAGEEEPPVEEPPLEEPPV